MRRPRQSGSIVVTSSREHVLMGSRGSWQRSRCRWASAIRDRGSLSKKQIVKLYQHEGPKVANTQRSEGPILRARYSVSIPKGLGCL